MTARQDDEIVVKITQGPLKSPCMFLTQKKIPAFFFVMWKPSFPGLCHISRQELKIPVDSCL